MCVLAIASASMHPPRTHARTHVGASARTIPATVLPQPTRSPGSAPGAPLRSVAATVARVRPLPRRPTPRTAAARAHTPSPRHRPQQRPAARTPTRHASAAHEHHPRRAQLDCALRGPRHPRPPDDHGPTRPLSDWQPLATRGADPPDPDTLIAPLQPETPGTGPAAARRAALGFTRGYLNYTYGHAAAKQLRDLTSTLRAAIAANPPCVPAAVRALHPRVASVALIRQGTGWLADANVTDEQDTYQVISEVCLILFPKSGRVIRSQFRGWSWGSGLMVVQGSWRG